MKRILCWFGKHEPKTTSRFSEGVLEGYFIRVSRCKRCNKPLLQNPFDTTWWAIEEDLVKDMDI